MRYILGVIIAVIIAFIAIFAIVNRDTNTDVNSAQTTKITLSQLANTDAKITYVIRGRITGNDTFRAIRITVTPTSRTLEILNGYEYLVERSQSFANNQAAFSTLLYALDNAGFLNSQTTRFDNEKGACATGNTFTYGRTEAGGAPQELWSSSCNKREGTFAGSASAVRQLMQAQITDYNRLVAGVRL